MMDKGYLLLIDADDTLWESALFFRRTEEDFLSLMKALGADVDEVRRTVHRRDVERLSETGYGAQPYMDTLVSIMEEFSPEPPGWALDSLDDMRKCLVGHPVVLAPGVPETLASVSRLPFYPMVYTMGEEDHQRDKFRRSGLSPMVSELTVVPEKTRESLGNILIRTGYSAERTLLVGNSPRSDINPATALGISAVFLRRELTWSAEHQEFLHPDLVTIIDSFKQLIPVLEEFMDTDPTPAGKEDSASGWRCGS